MQVYLISFSPTGGTRRVLDLLAEGMEMEPAVVELCSQDAVQQIAFEPDDICLVGAPVYGGRVPAMESQKLRELFGAGEDSCGNSCRAVAVAVYGNRAFDDALVELRDILTDGGCRVTAGVAAVAEHSIVRMYGEGRPDSVDAVVLRQFGRSIIVSMERESTGEPQLPGNRPYKDGGNGGPHPLPGESCTQCGNCARMCPAGAISADGQQLDEEKCISCMRCSSVCPNGARQLPAALLSGLEQRLRLVCSQRKEDQLFL